MYCCEYRLKAAAWDLTVKHEKQRRRGGREMNRKIDREGLKRRHFLWKIIEKDWSWFPNLTPVSGEAIEGEQMGEFPYNRSLSRSIFSHSPVFYGNQGSSVCKMTDCSHKCRSSKTRCKGCVCVTCMWWLSRQHAHVAQKMCPRPAAKAVQEWTYPYLLCVCVSGMTSLADAYQCACLVLFFLFSVWEEGGTGVCNCVCLG